MSIQRFPALSGGDAPWAAAADLMTDVSSGSQTAFAQVYDLTCAHVFGFLLGMIGSREPAEEALQDTYLHVWSRASEFTSCSGGVRAWISEIAHRRAIDRIRNGGGRAEGVVAESEPRAMSST